MTTFSKPGQTLRSRESTLVVDGTLKPGRHRFALRVFGRDEVPSVLDEVIVEITDTPIFNPRSTGTLR